MDTKDRMIKDLIYTLCRKSDKAKRFVKELNTSQDYSEDAVFETLRYIVRKHRQDVDMYQEEYKEQRDNCGAAEQAILDSIFSGDNLEKKKELVSECRIYKEDGISESFMSFKELGFYITDFCFNDDVVIKSRDTSYIKTEHGWIVDNSGKETETIIKRFIKNQDFSVKDGERDILINRPSKWREAYETIALETTYVDNFNDKMFEYEQGRVFFKDGCYNFNEKKFEWDNNTRIHIDRNYPKKSNPKLREELCRRVLWPFFTIREEDHPENAERQEVMDFFIHRLSRALSGLGSNKNPIQSMGDRDGGKSLLVKLFKTAFGAYMNTFDLEILRKDNSPDTSRDNAKWAEYETKRLAVSLESPDKSIVLDGSKIKKFFSNGDQIQFRHLRKEVASCYIKPFGFFFVNDAPKISGKDATDKFIEVKLNTSFYNADETPKEKRYDTSYWVEQDDSVNSFVKRTDVGNEFLLMVIEAHDTIINVPQRMKEDKKQDDISLNDIIEDVYIRTGSDDDFVSYDEIKPVLMNELTHGGKILKRFREVFGSDLEAVRKGRSRGISKIKIKTEEI